MCTIHIVASIATGSDCDNFYLFDIVRVRYFSESSEIILYRELVDDKEFSSLIAKGDLGTEEIVVVLSCSIPCWYTRP
jgi:hypothetical protein